MWFERFFGKLFGEKRTSLPVGPAVTYDYTLHRLLVAEQTSHPIAKFGFNPNPVIGKIVVL